MLGVREYEGGKSESIRNFDFDYLSRILRRICVLRSCLEDSGG